MKYGRMTYATLNMLREAGASLYFTTTEMSLSPASKVDGEPILTSEVCPRCGGSGFDPEPSRVEVGESGACLTCYGNGKTPEEYFYDD